MPGRMDGDQVGTNRRSIPIPMMTIFASHVCSSSVFFLYPRVSSFTPLITLSTRVGSSFWPYCAQFPTKYFSFTTQVYFLMIMTTYDPQCGMKGYGAEGNVTVSVRAKACDIGWALD